MWLQENSLSINFKIILQRKFGWDFNEITTRVKKNKVCQSCHNRLINSAGHMLNTLDSRGKKKKQTKKSIMLAIRTEGLSIWQNIGKHQLKGLLEYVRPETAQQPAVALWEPCVQRTQLGWFIKATVFSDFIGLSQKCRRHFSFFF